MSSTETPLLPPPPPPPTPAINPPTTPAPHQKPQSSSTLPPIPKSTHLYYLRQTINLAQKSPPKPTNFRVGCVLVSYPNLTPTPIPTSTSSSSSSPPSPVSHTLSTGYTLELPGNTHAEQCALSKLTLTHPPLPSPNSASTSSSASSIPHLPPPLNTILYTSLEPCSLRLSGNTPCVQRILATRQEANNPLGGIRKVIFGAKEPGTFVRDSQTCRLLTDAGVEWEYLPDLEGEILRVAMEGHSSDKNVDVNMGGVGGDREQEKSQGGGQANDETRIDDITDEERRRQEALPRNPKKRMMELEPGGGK